MTHINFKFNTRSIQLFLLLIVSSILSCSSALAANGDAGMAMLVTHLGAASGVVAWIGLEWIRHGKPSVLGAVTGMVAGLGTITMTDQVVVQLIGIGATIVWCALATYILLKLVGLMTDGLRVSEEDENEGLDIVSHDETGYNL